jgi:hypothetical protein
MKYLVEHKAKNDQSSVSCKLTTPELKKQKETIIKDLKSQLLTKKELKNGYYYKFTGSDNMIDALAEFIKTERKCCSFFTFKLSISGDASEVLLEITGPKGAKEFLKSELEM